MIGQRIEQRLVERESRFKVKVKRHQRQNDWATLSITADHIVATPKGPSDYTMMVTDQPENGKSSVDQTTVWTGCDLTAIPE